MQTVIVLDFGGQYKELIARRIRECGVYSIIMPGDTSIESIKKIDPIGVVLTGGPNSVNAPNSPKAEKELFELGIPVLGICYGMQAMCYSLGGKVDSCKVSEFGDVAIEVIKPSIIFEELKQSEIVLMSHSDFVSIVPEGFEVTSKTADCGCASIENKKKQLFAVQFHPEVERTHSGKKIFKNFLYNVCNAKGDYKVSNFVKTEIKQLKEKYKNEKVILGLSGGVDSSVCAALLSKAIGKNLICIFVDHGFMRKNEGDEIQAAFKNFDLKFVRVDAEQRFLSKLEGITDPEQKRKIIGAEFIRVFEEQAEKFGDAKYLAQGTIYADIIESGTSNSAVIKSHHNVGGLPKNMRFIGLVEPLRNFFKDEVRKIGRMLKLPENIVARQPFPGPGLAIRVIGELKKDKLDLLREVDSIFREEIQKNKIKCNQYFAVLTNLQSVGVMGDFRTYEYAVALRAVNTNDFMTCEYTKVSHLVLSKISLRITNEVKGINRVLFDITGKPPATIEYE